VQHTAHLSAIAADGRLQSLW
jgi:hypothetical protein